MTRLDRTSGPIAAASPRPARFRAAAALTALTALILGLGCDPVFLPLPSTGYRLPGNTIPEANLEELQLESTDGVLLAGMYAFQDGPAPHVIFFHGQSATVDTHWRWPVRLWESGYSVLSIDYRGYGPSTGTPTEQGLYDDAATALAWLEAREGVDRERVVVWGFSLGTGVASWLAAEADVCALVLEAPYTSISDILAGASPLDLPPDWASPAGFDTLGRIADIDAPLVVAHGTDDVRIPIAMGEAVFDAAEEPKRFVRVEGATHMTTFERAEEEILGTLAGLADCAAP